MSWGWIVWQDFMFACWVYDLILESFEEPCRVSSINIVWKNPPSYLPGAFWCGNNEMEMLLLKIGKDGGRNPVQFKGLYKNV